jgi:hypothetical protein
MAKAKKSEFIVKLVEVFHKKKSKGIIVMVCDPTDIDKSIKSHIARNLVSVAQFCTYKIIEDPTALPIGFAERIMVEIETRIQHLEQTKKKLLLMFFPKERLVKKQMWGIKIKGKDILVKNRKRCKSAVWAGGHDAGHYVIKKFAARFNSEADAKKHISMNGEFAAKL